MCCKFTSSADFFLKESYKIINIVLDHAPSKALITLYAAGLSDISLIKWLHLQPVLLSNDPALLEIETNKQRYDYIAQALATEVKILLDASREVFQQY